MGATGTRSRARILWREIQGIQTLRALDVVNVLLALEETFSFEVSPDEFDPLRFDTVDGIVELVDEAASA